MMYKRYREESETARMVCCTLLSCILCLQILDFLLLIINGPLMAQMEEEKALKQLRRTMVPHARPVPNFNHPFCPQKYENKSLADEIFFFYITSVLG